MIDLLEFLEERDIVVNGIYVSPAKPIIITQQLPYSNTVYDFSKLTGDYNYYPATVDVKITYGSNIEKSLYRKIISSVISNISSQDIKIPMENGAYYKGVYIGCSDIETKGEVVGITELQFRCEPFKISEVKYGEELWDTFCFETDNLGINSYTVNPNSTVEIINPGMYVNAVITVSSQLKVSTNNKEITLKAKTNNILKLKNGENIIKVLEGSGSLKIDFYPCYL